jgi:hypothetical protein
MHKVKLHKRVSGILGNLDQDHIIIEEHYFNTFEKAVAAAQTDGVAHAEIWNPDGEKVHTIGIAPEPINHEVEAKEAAPAAPTAESLEVTEAPADETPAEPAEEKKSKKKKSEE